MFLVIEVARHSGTAGLLNMSKGRCFARLSGAASVIHPGCYSCSGKMRFIQSILAKHWLAIKKQGTTFLGVSLGHL